MNEQPKATLEEKGFEQAGENEAWVGFSKNEPEVHAKLYDKQKDFENFIADVEYSPVPEDILPMYKVGILVDEGDVEETLGLLADHTEDLPMYGKVLKPEFRDDPDVPPIVLYAYDTNVKFLLEASVRISDMLEEKYGVDELHQEHKMARYVGSRVFITQGNHTSKEELKTENPQLFETIYSDDGAIYKANEVEFIEKVIRTGNQIEIAETYADYVNGPALSERLVAFQQESLRGVALDEEIELGVRHTAVRMGGTDGDVSQRFMDNPDYELQDYYAPRAEAVPEILGRLDTFYKRYLDDEKVLRGKDKMDRLCSAAYVGFIGAHPLEDGNSQSASNVVSSMLFESGRPDYFIKNTHLSKYKFVEGFIDPSEAVPDPYTVKLVRGDDTEKDVAKENANKAMRERQDVSEDVLMWMFSDEGQVYLDNYIQTGRFEEVEVSEFVKDNIKPYLEAIKSYNDFLSENTAENLVGDLEHTYDELNKMHEQALHQK